MVHWRQNHRKTIESNGAPEKNHYHSIVLKKLLLSKSNVVFLLIIEQEANVWDMSGVCLLVSGWCLGMSG